MLPDVITFVAIAIPAVIAITFHEAAHGYAALAFGDPTAAEHGRLSLNPLKHVDPFGTVVLPIMLMLAGAPVLGWAKPVPVNFNRLRSPKSDMVWVAVAGPAMNIALAFVAAGVFHMVGPDPDGWPAFAHLMAVNGLTINVLLAVFNMIPLPPLDGSRVAVGLLPVGPARRLARLEKYGMLILIGVLILLPWLGGKIGLDLDVFGRVVPPIVDGIVEQIARVTAPGGP